MFAPISGCPYTFVTIENFDDGFTASDLYFQDSRDGLRAENRKETLFSDRIF
jgi:hypothetical protein